MRAEQSRACAVVPLGDLHPDPGGEGGAEEEDGALEDAAGLLDTQVPSEWSHDMNTDL